MLARSRRLSAAAAIALLGYLAAPGPAFGEAKAGQKQEQEAKRLREQAERIEDDIDRLEERLTDITKRANAAMEEYQAAQDARRDADAKTKAAAEALAAADASVHEANEDFSEYVVLSFQAGGTDGGLPGMAAVLQGDPLALPDQISLLSKTAEYQAAIVDKMQRAKQAQETAARTAEQAASTAAAASDAARVAKTKADELVAEQTRQLAQMERRLSSTNASAKRLEQAAEKARRKAAAERRARALAEAARRAQNRFGGTPECRGGNLDGYSNGWLPLSALCPLWGTGGHILRSDAADAFNRMSKSYAEVFGSPICVTDSYRSFPDQVDVKRRKPTLAATPGTSNHGWGRAVDLCGGIERDGTATNSWLRLNAPRFGWYHPRWADAGGSGPYEPWHWEYAA